MIPPKVTHAADCNGTIWNHECHCMPARVLHAREQAIKSRLRTVAFGVAGSVLGGFVGVGAVHFITWMTR